MEEAAAMVEPTPITPRRFRVLINEGRVSPPPVKAGDLPENQRDGRDPRRWLIRRGFKVTRDRAQITSEERARVLELRDRGDKAEVIRRRLNGPRREVGDPEVSIETIYRILRESRARAPELSPEVPSSHHTVTASALNAEDMLIRASQACNGRLGEHALSVLVGIGAYHASLVSYAALKSFFKGLPKIPDWM